MTKKVRNIDEGGEKNDGSRGLERTINKSLNRERKRKRMTRRKMEELE